MLVFIRVFLRANNNHSHLSIKNSVKSLILLVFLALRAKMTKKEGKSKGRGGGGGGGMQARLNTASQNFQRGSKNWGRVCTK